jgi:hypothetical protein
MTTPIELNHHPLYVYAEGGIGKWDVKIWLPRFVSDRVSSNDTLLLNMKGARKELRLERVHPYEVWRIDFATEATDDEHDRAHLIDLWVAAPKITFEYDDHIEAVGWLYDMRIPTQEWLDEQLASTNMCSHCQGQEEGCEPHQIVEYIPPERVEVARLGTPFVRMEFERRS